MFGGNRNEKTCPCVGDIFDVGAGTALAEGRGGDAAWVPYRVRWCSPVGGGCGAVVGYTAGLDCAFLGILEVRLEETRAGKTKQECPQARQPKYPTTAASPEQARATMTSAQLNPRRRTAQRWERRRFKA